MQRPGINNSRRVVLLPLLTALSLVLGLLLGFFLFGRSTSYHDATARNAAKYREVLSWVQQAYVDSVNTDTLADYSITAMLSYLDPHSVYIPRKDVAISKAQLESGFDGIGIEFSIFHDTVYVINAIPGGPSERAGLRSGDRLLQANTTPLIGPMVSNELIFNTLRGPGGTPVALQVARRGQPHPLSFTVTRGRIPAYSVVAAYLTDPQTGYIKIDRFSETTFTEFQDNLSRLKALGMTRLLLDLRGNGGGYKDRATDLVDELLAGRKLIVSTDGRGQAYDEKTFSGRTGRFETQPVVVLVDGNSASASEIVAGALQDHDRALIVGRRTFGKGLVQAPIDLSDGSQLRLTISRYYTPSGRSIQKPYTAYGHDEENRLKNGELFMADSMKYDPHKLFHTDHGRNVYGGGGILPDVFVPIDTSYRTRYLYELSAKNVVAEYAFRYASENRERLGSRPFADYQEHFFVSEKMLTTLHHMAAASGLKPAPGDLARTNPFLKTQLKALIAAYLWERRNGSPAGLRNELYKILNADDPTYRKALTLFPQAGALLKP